MENKSNTYWWVLGLSVVLAGVGIVSLAMGGSDNLEPADCRVLLNSTDPASEIPGCYLPSGCKETTGARKVLVPDSALSQICGEYSDTL